MASTESSNAVTTVSLTPEQFERMYLASPSNKTRDFRAAFGNPTPFHGWQVYLLTILIRAILGLVMSLTPLSCDLMGWRGAGVLGAASTGVYYFTGGLLMILSGLLEFLLGNTFQFILFCGYGTAFPTHVRIPKQTIADTVFPGSFWLALGATLTPYFGAYEHYSPDPTSAAAGLSSMGFNASFGFYLVFMAVFSFLACICALRTNLCYTLLEFFVFLFFALLAAAFFRIADGGSNASKVQTASGAFGFVASIFGWYFFFALSLASVNFPITLPVFDLSGLAKSEKAPAPTNGAAPTNGHHDKETV
ncbi:Protein alcS [Lachnellula cervina]|uniref:Protein alcS n=1 Tax=Lachnellula cervina TaxID=1316786 RepID=A0A7D8UP26_9HELO|nr:Protein alcS [Lachnellula cervina]